MNPVCALFINKLFNHGEPFFFNIKEDAQGEVRIQSGETLKHSRIFITSKKLMSFL